MKQMIRKLIHRQFNIFNLLLVVVMLVGTLLVGSAIAADHNVSFAWTYPAEQNSVINGFRIFDMTDSDKPVLVVEYAQGSLRAADVVIKLSDGANWFSIAAYIGDSNGPFSNPVSVNQSPMTKPGLSATCVTCQ
jgi:hypothetical protein